MIEGAHKFENKMIPFHEIDWEEFERRWKETEKKNKEQGIKFESIGFPECFLNYEIIVNTNEHRSGE